MIRYYLIKEVDGVVVRRTEVTHTEPRDAKGTTQVNPVVVGK